MDNTTETQYQNPSIKGSSKAVLVTGGAGYVGSHTCKLLAKNGYLPITVDRHYREGLKSFGPNYNLNLPQEMDRIDEIVNRYNITSCIHFAGSTSVPESVANPSLYYKNNLITTISLLDNLSSVVSRHSFTVPVRPRMVIQDSGSVENQMSPTLSVHMVVAN